MGFPTLSLLKVRIESFLGTLSDLHGEFRNRVRGTTVPVVAVWGDDRDGHATVQWCDKAQDPASSWVVAAGEIRLMIP